MNILTLDPGTRETGWARISGGWHIESCGIDVHDDIIGCLSIPSSDIVVIEKPAPMGMALGHDLLETIYMAGRYEQAARTARKRVITVPRPQVKRALLGRVAGKDTNVNAALRAWLCARHGCDEKQLKGTKKNPGPCYGVRSHIWAALAVAVAAHELGEL